MPSNADEMFVPFILQFAEKQIDVPKNYHSYYDNERNVTVMEENGVPLVESCSAFTETMTKTEVARESEDADPTNTFELKTKTFVKRESEDEDFHSVIFEMLTKTRVPREGDEVGDNAELL